MAPAAATQPGPRSVSFVGTNTTDPGPGRGSLVKSSERRRVRTAPFAYCTRTLEASALNVSPPAAST